MSLRVQKRWSQLGAPSKPGAPMVPNVGKIVEVTHDHLHRAGELGGDPVVVLEAVESPGMIARWRIIEMKAGDA